MKILYAHRTLSADGQFVHIRALIEALRARGATLRVVGPAGADALDRSLDTGSQSRLRAALPKALGEIAERAFDLKARRQLIGEARAFAPDIVYCRHNLFYRAGVEAARAIGVPCLLEVNAPLAEERARHGGLALVGAALRHERETWRAADRLLPVTSALGEKLIAAGVDRDRVHIVPNGAPEAFLSPPSGARVRERYGLQDCVVLGFTGFVRDWHGVDKIIRALPALDQNVRLLIVGDGSARAALEVLGDSLCVADRVVWTGVVQPGDLPAHVAAFDGALRSAATAYASPLKLFEYMAASRAILAPRQGNIEEILSDDEDARLFSGDEEIAPALAALTRDEALRGRLGAAARATLERRDYRWSGNARRVMEIAEDAIGGKR